MRKMQNKQLTLPKKYSAEKGALFMAKRKHNINKTLAMTLIFSGAALIILAFLLMRLETILGWIGSFLSILRPVFIGIVLTFVLYGPTVKISRFLEKITKGKRFPCNGVAVLLSYLFFFGILTGLIWIVVPSFITSFDDFTGKFSTYIVNIQKSLDNALNFLKNGSGISLLEQFNLDTRDIISQVSTFVSKIPNYMPDVMEKIGQWASSLAGVLADIGFGVAFSVYILIGKNRLKRQIKRISKTFFSETSYKRISYYSKLTFNTFSNFVSGQLMEALILGLLCFIGMTILGFPYAIMISVIIGVTNIIPIIGPIIGTIPGAAIYLMIDPWKAVWFVIFVIILQQIDSNLIYPRVVGGSVGLPAIWILFAVTVGGGFFGVIGMVIGVPLMSVIYTVLREKTAEAEEESNKVDTREPMFPEAREKTSAMFSKIKSSVHSGFSSILDKIDDRIHKRNGESETEDVSDKELADDDKAESNNIDKVLDKIENEEEKTNQE